MEAVGLLASRGGNGKRPFVIAGVCPDPNKTIANNKKGRLRGTGVSTTTRGQKLTTGGNVVAGHGAGKKG